MIKKISQCFLLFLFKNYVLGRCATDCWIERSSSAPGDALVGAEPSRDFLLKWLSTAKPQCDAFPRACAPNLSLLSQISTSGLKVLAGMPVRSGFLQFDKMCGIPREIFVYREMLNSLATAEPVLKMLQSKLPFCFHLFFPLLRSLLMRG